MSMNDTGLIAVVAYVTESAMVMNAVYHAVKRTRPHAIHIEEHSSACSYLLQLQKVAKPNATIVIDEISITIDTKQATHEWENIKRLVMDRECTLYAAIPRSRNAPRTIPVTDSIEQCSDVVYMAEYCEFDDMSAGFFKLKTVSHRTATELPKDIYLRMP